MAGSDRRPIFLLQGATKLFRKTFFDRYLPFSLSQPLDRFSDYFFAVTLGEVRVCQLRAAIGEYRGRRNKIPQP